MSSPTLFISYSSRSQLSVDLAHELAHSLRNDGYEVFLDKDDLPAGESFDDRIGQAIARSDGYIFLAAPEALEPGAYTLTELGHAKRAWRSGQGRVLPVLLGGIPVERLDAYLRVLNVVRPAGNARAEVLAETKRLWPIAAEPARGAAEGWRHGKAPRASWLLAAALLAVLCVLGFSLYYTLRYPTPIHKIIAEEARLAEAEEVEEMLQLFTDDAVIKAQDFAWDGKDRIRERYLGLADQAEFYDLEHVDVLVQFDPSGNRARATSRTRGQISWNGKPKETLNHREEWTFVKDMQDWRIREVQFLGR